MKRCLVALATFATLACGSAADAKNPVVAIKTNMGTIKVELFPDSAPVTVKNFLQYVDAKHYDGTVFHRVIPDFMIQGGGFKKGFANIKTEKDLAALRLKTRDAIKNESDNKLLNRRGAIAMARTSRADSATDQFFINVKDNEFLDRAKARDKVGYCVFGKVIEGMDIVDKIKQVKTKGVLDDAFENVPAQDVVIESIRREGK